MYLVDTSCWVELLRTTGKSDVKNRLSKLIEEEEAAWCPIIRLELWNGARSDRDVRQLIELEGYITSLSIPEPAWNDSIFLCRRLRERGFTVPMQNIVIAACARHHQVDIESEDKHFQYLAKLR